MNDTQRPLLIKISELISNIFNPLVSILLFFAYFSLHHFNVSEAVHYFLPAFLIVVAPVVVWIFWNVKAGRYKDANVSNRRARMSLYLFLEATLVAYLAYRYFREGETDFIVLFLLFLLVAMHISNYMVKSSMHTAVNVFVAALFSTENLWLGGFWVLLSIVVAITRVILKRHTVAEVITGGLIGAFISIIFLYTHIQLNNGI